MANAAMEFHDSTVAAAKTNGAEVTVVFSPAYIHRSDGTPGVDRGTGWLQQTAMVLRECELPLDLPKLPLVLFDGLVVLEARTYNGLVPLPLSYMGSVFIDLTFQTGARVRLSAKEIRIDSVGEATYLEEVS